MGEELESISLSSNTFGPVLISRLLLNNNLLILVFNYIIFLISFHLLRNFKQLNPIKLALFLISSPMLFSSITTLNKEILSFFCVSFLISISNKRLTVFNILIVMFSSLLVRWQMIVVSALFLFLNKVVRKDLRSRFISIISFLMLLSFLYPFIRNFLDLDVVLSVDQYTETSESNSGFIYMLNSLQNNYMLFFSFVPKTLMNLVANPGKLFQSYDTLSNPYDIYNNYVVPGQGLITTLLIILSFKKFRINSFNSSHYLILIYSIVFSLSPFIQTRYFFPLYPLLCIQASQRVKSVIHQ